MLIYKAMISLYYFYFFHSRPLPKQPEALKWVVASNSVHLPAKHTVYWCTMVRLPDLPGKHHMIGYKPVLSPGSER